MEAKQKRNKTVTIFFLVPDQKKKRLGLPKRLALVRTTPWADLAIIGAQL